MNGIEALKKLFFDNEDLRVDITLNDRKVCEIYNAIRNDLERLEKIEKGLKELSNKGGTIYYFPNGRKIFGFDISNLENEGKILEETKEYIESKIKEIIGE